MNTDTLFEVIGKLYVDLYNMKKIIEMLQQQVKEKDIELIELKRSRTKDE